MSAVEIVATPADPNANSYVTVAQADAYHAASLDGQEWLDADSPRALALIAATRTIDTRLRLRGEPLHPTQARHWPTHEERWQTVGQEEITADLDTAVDLDHEALRENSEKVQAADGTTFDRDTDYEIDHEDGTITALSSGDMTQGTTYYIQYQYTGIPAIVRAATCEQALYMLQQSETPELIDRQLAQAQGVRHISLDGVSETYGGPTTELCPTAQSLLAPYIDRTARITGRGGK